jgi:hypothetical protein
MYKDAERQREYNRRKQAERRARQRTEKNTTPLSVSASSSPLQGVPGVEPLDGEELLTVEVKTDDTPAPKLTLKERLFGSHPSVPQPLVKKPATRASKKQSENLVSTVLPTVIASFIATYSRQLLPEEYKPCAPSMEECNGILAPLLAIIGRRVEVVGKASQDAIDITNSIICSIAYGTRAYIVYAEVSKLKEQREAKRTAESAAESRGSYQAANPGINGTGTAGDDNGSQGTIRSLNGHADNLESDTASRDSEAAIVANMFARDKYGRVGLGLLPRELL